MEGKPYEVMGGLPYLIEIPRGKPDGILFKNPPKPLNFIYDLKVGKKGNPVIIQHYV